LKKSSSKKKTADALDDVFLEALKDEIPMELSAEEVLSEEELEGVIEPPVSEGEKAVQKDVSPEESPAKAGPDLGDGLHVVVSEDGMRASLVVKNCPPFEVAAIKEELQKHGVVYGLKEKAIANAVTALKTGAGWKGELLVAAGSQPGLHQLMDYHFLERGKDPSGKKHIWMAGGVPLFFGDVSEVFSAQSLEVIKKSGVCAKAVDPYEVIATLKGDVKSIQGYDVYGKPVGDLLTAPEAGENVEFDDEEGTYTSQSFGYLVLTEKTLSVVSPVWVPQDQMAMYFVNLNQAGKICFPYPENIQKMLVDREVHSTAALIESIEQLSAAFAAGRELPRTIKIAQGIPPIPGKDATFEFFHDTEVKAGTIREKDDSIDLKERNLVTSVDKDTLLGEKTLPTKGVPGKTIYGTDVEAPDGKDRVISINEGVYEKPKDEGAVCYFAKVDGNLSYKKDNISIKESFGIEGDVDYSTGNIVVKTGLTIGGSVSPDFSVKSGGNTIIGGSVELGAEVFVDGDLSIKGGVIGESTKVIVIGNLEVGFIQDSEIVVKGDLVVNNYIFNGTVRASGEIRVRKESGSLGGKIIGGYVCATTGIDVPTVGSSTVRNTIVSLQADPVIIGKKQKMAKDIDYCDQNISKMLRTLQVKRFDPVAIKSMLDKAPPEKKQMMVKILKTLQKFIKHRAETIEKKEQVKAYIEQCLKKATIRVASEFYEGNTVEIGKFKYVAQDDMKSSVFQLQNDMITY